MSLALPEILIAIPCLIPGYRTVSRNQSAFALLESALSRFGTNEDLGTFCLSDSFLPHIRRSLCLTKETEGKGTLFQVHILIQGQRSKYIDSLGTWTSRTDLVAWAPIASLLPPMSQFEPVTCYSAPHRSSPLRFCLSTRSAMLFLFGRDNAPDGTQPRCTAILHLAPPSLMT